MIKQSLLNTNETCYSVRITKICNLNEASFLLLSPCLYLKPGALRSQSLVMPISQSPIHSKNTSRSRVCFARTITEIFLCSIQHAIIASSGAIQRASNQTFEHIYIGLDFLVNFILVCIHCLFITSFAFRRCSACLSNLLTSLLESYTRLNHFHLGDWMIILFEVARHSGAPNISLFFWLKVTAN